MGNSYGCGAVAMMRSFPQLLLKDYCARALRCTVSSVFFCAAKNGGRCVAPESLGSPEHPAPFLDCDRDIFVNLV